MDDKEKLTEALKRANSTGIADLAAAYVKAWAEIDNVVKNAANPHFGSKYADLGAVIDTIRPVFARHDLALLTAPGELTGDKMSLVWMLLHKSGQSMNGTMSVPIGNKSTAQAAGSCITYMRRYLLAAVGGVAQVDDDGNAASGTGPKRTPSTEPRETASDGRSASDLLDAIAAATSLDDLNALRDEAKDLGDQKVATAWAARKRELRGAK